MTPLLKFFFTVSYVVLAAFVGAFADSMPKGKVMFITNPIKIGGCLLMLFGAHPLLAYAVVGFGAAAYSPAKYGILTELLPPEKLVVANGWIEGTDGRLHHPRHRARRHPDQPARRRVRCSRSTCRCIDTGIDTPAEAAIAVITSVLRDRRALQPRASPTPARATRTSSAIRGSCWSDFAHCFSVAVARQARADLARGHDALLGRGRDAAVHRAEVGRAGAGAAAVAARPSCRASSRVGIALGAVLAARLIPLKQSLRVLPVGVAMGIVAWPLLMMTLVPAGDVTSACLDGSFLLIACSSSC